MAYAIQIHDTGGPEVLSYEEVELEGPGPTQALIAQKAIGVNYIDTYHRKGLYSLSEMPHGIGMEGAGVVEAVGDGVSHLEPGDRVDRVDTLTPPPCLLDVSSIHLVQ
jgi:NADPH2:quinone reductase